MMKVRATQIGYYGLNRRYVGEVFEIKNDQEFSKRWMEPADTVDSKAVVPDKPRQAMRGKQSGSEVI